jgi:hypothetical protein
MRSLVIIFALLLGLLVTAIAQAQELQTQYCVVMAQGETTGLIIAKIYSREDGWVDLATDGEVVVGLNAEDFKKLHPNSIVKVQKVSGSDYDLAKSMASL